VTSGKKLNKFAATAVFLGAAVFFLAVAGASAGRATVVGKLTYYQYDAYPYVLEFKSGNPIALEVTVDKNNRNKAMDKLLGKKVRVTGQARVITAMTELHGLKIIDIRPGKGSIKALK
jgi:hypothetical protein